MPSCYRLDLPGGGVALVRGNLGPHCHCCSRVGEFLCDFPVGHGKTCDKRLCGKHRHQAEPGVDYCLDHHVEWRRGGGVGPQEPWKQGDLL